MTADKIDLNQFEGHTPGPWNTHDRSEITHGYHSWHVAPESGRTIAVLTHTKTVKVDGTLIAAAPSLLALARSQQEQIKQLRDALSPLVKAADESHANVANAPLWVNARAALAATDKE